MSKRNDLPVLIVSLLVTLGLLGAGIFWLRNSFLSSDSGGNAPTASVEGDSADEGVASEGATSGDVLPESISPGGIDIAGADGSSGVSVLRGAVSASKQNGLKALAQGDYAAAEREFTDALAANRNDPESLIYLNNAAIGNAASHSVALIVPGAGDDTKLGTSQELMRGAAQAQDAINAAGGINGTPLRVLIVDDQNDPEVAAEVASSLAADANVLGVIGHFSSGTTLATTGIYEAEGLTLISPTSTSVEISLAGDYIFRTVPSDRLAASILADHALDTLNMSRAAVFYESDSNYSRSLKSEFETELVSSGGTIVEVFDISDRSFQAASAIQTAREQGAEVLMLALTLNVPDPLLQILTSNEDSLPMLGSDSLYKYRVLSLGGPNALGLTVAVPWHILRHEQSDFVQDSRQLWGADVNWRTAMAYDAVVALAAGIEANPTREGVAAALADANFQVEGATSPVRFLPTTGDRNQPFQLVEVVEGDRSGAGYDFVPVN